MHLKMSGVNCSETSCRGGWLFGYYVTVNEYRVIRQKNARDASILQLSGCSPCNISLDLNRDTSEGHCHVMIQNHERKEAGHEPKAANSRPSPYLGFTTATSFPEAPLLSVQ